MSVDLAKQRDQLKAHEKDLKDREEAVRQVCDVIHFWRCPVSCTHIWRRLLVL